jgi:hypothetical protein
MSDCSISVLEKRIRKDTVRENIKKILKAYPAAKGCYLLMELLYYRDIEGMDIRIDYERIRKVPSPLTLSRRAQEIVSEWDETYGSLGNPYAPTAGTRVKRRSNEGVHRDYYSKLKRSDSDTAGYTDGALV